MISNQELSSPEAGEGGSDAEAESSGALTIAANRLPVTRADGQWAISPGGLVRALIPVMRARDAVWIGWSGQTDNRGGVLDYEGLRLLDIPISAREHDQYYRKVSNQMLWPLFHDGVRHPVFDERAWRGYEGVNRRFAEAIASQTPRNGTVWLQDYHLLLAPGMLRELRPDLRIGLFIHIPVPPVELFATLPWREEIANSLGSADLIGTQTPADAEHMRDLIRGPGLFASERKTDSDLAQVDDFPISIETRMYRDAAQRADREGSSARIRERLGCAARTMLLGVDRLDYTKGIDRRLEAFEAALRRGRLDPDRVRFVQVAVPSRESVEEYSEMSDRIDAIVGRINGVYGGLHGPVVHYIKTGLRHDELIPLYRAADVMVVTPFRDGMNLVAKEYVATRYDATGELILSEFAGAAHELSEATLVNPHDIGAVEDAIVKACDCAEARLPRNSMSRMHEHVRAHDVHRWSRRFLGRLDEIARRPSARPERAILRRTRSVARG